MKKVDDRAVALDEEFRRGLAIAAEHLGLELGIVSHIDGDTYTVRHFHAEEGGLEAGQQFPLGQTYCALTIAAGSIVAIDEMTSSPFRGHPCYEAFGLESYIGAPLRLADKTYGTLSFSARARRAAPYTESERALVRLLVSWVESGLEREALAASASEAERRFEAVFDAGPDGLALHRDGVLLAANDSLIRMLGYPGDGSMLNRPMLEFIAPEFRQRAIERIAMQAEGNVPLEAFTMQALRRDGSRVWVETVASFVDLDGERMTLTSVRDLSRRDEFEQLMQAQRLAAIGAMASGIAHDLRNPLAAMLLNVKFGLRRAAELEESEASAEIATALQNAETATNHMKAIVDGILGFARESHGARAVCRVQDLVDIAATVAKSELRARVRLERDLGEVPEVRVDRDGVVQVLVNLVVNAAQAIREHGDGCGVVGLTSGTDPEGRVRITVSDTGPGIVPEAAERIFERFFTTKRDAGGVGLGLALSRDIVEAHGGTLTAANDPGGGAAFTLTLPPAADPQAPSTATGRRP